MLWKVSMVKTTVLFTCDQLLRALIHFNIIILILICVWFIMSGVNYVIYGCSSARTTPEVSLYWSFLTLEKNIKYYITQNREKDDNLERQIKNLNSYLPKFFNILAFGQKYFSFYPFSLFNNNIASYIAS